MKELFNAIQVVKLNAWEEKLAERVASSRSTELAALRSFLVTVCPRSCSVGVSVGGVGCFLSCLLDRNGAVSYGCHGAHSCRTLQRTSHTTGAKVSLSRMSKYLSYPDYRAENVLQEDASQAEDADIVVENKSFEWETNSPILTSMNLQIKKRDLVVVRGAVGAGKSSLCSVCLAR